MRLDELVKTNFKQTPVKDYQTSEVPDYNRYYSTKEPGKGRFSQVEPDQNDPHMVNKTSLDPIQELETRDGYFYYINELHKSGLADSNPYFPRVYDVSIHKDSKGNATYSTHMEKLIEGGDVSEDELMHAANRCFKDFPQAMQRKSEFNSTGKPPANRKELILQTISQMLYLLERGHDISKDPLLTSAMKFISDLLRKNKKVDEDFNQTNFMFRRGKYGLQLVITDPMSNQI